MIIWRMALSSPPGVSMRITTSSCTLCLGLVEAAHQVVDAGRADGVIDTQYPDCTRRCLTAWRDTKQQQQQ
ncbi:hypothetical protein PPS11_38110 [Pseudomonas putida S11]|nr:hypothetical protein PPS11_38110 [Pseudomonas putida S11]